MRLSSLIKAGVRAARRLALGSSGFLLPSSGRRAVLGVGAPATANGCTKFTSFGDA